MKRIIVIAASAVLSMLSMISFAKDNNGHSLTALWKAYYAAESADKPKDQLSALEKIKKEAKAQKLAWDYYDACETYVRVSTYQNWKLRETRQEEFRKEIESFPVPVAAFYMNRSYSNEQLLEFVQLNRKALEAGNNAEFYSRDYTVTGVKYSDALLKLLRNDYEYALWQIYLRGGATDILQELYSGNYPYCALADYSRIQSLNDEARRSALADFGVKYAGKAAALLSEEDLLQLRFEDLGRDKKGTSSEYQALRTDLENFLRRKNNFSSQEKAIADCCVLAENLLETLDSKRTGFRVKDGELEIYMRNLPSVNIRLSKNKKTIWETTLQNSVRSYYKQDTLKLDMPSVDDGNYRLECFNGKIKAESSYEKYTVSAAFERDASGFRVYAADYLSGEPLKTVDVIVRDGDRKVLASCEGLEMDGFTKLPENIGSILGNQNSTCWVSVAFTDKDGRVRCSSDYGMRFYPESVHKSDESSHRCRLFADCTAFTPGETVHYKAVLYHGVRTLGSCGSGIRLQARLYDAEGKQIDSTDLMTNEFGSVAGEFEIKRGNRNGNYRISIYEGNRHLQSLTLRVDDFVLPTYELIWDTEEVFYLPVEKFYFKGKVLSYSGHSLGSARVSYTLRKNWQDIRTADLQLDSNGNFSIEVETDGERFQNYNVSITVVDATGETLEFMKYATVTEEPEKPVDYYFEEDEDSKGISVRAIAGSRRTWMVAELYGENQTVLERRLVEFAPDGDNPASTEVVFPYKDIYPDVISLHLLYFQNGDSYEYNCSRRRPDTRYDLPLSFTRFLDTTSPGSSYTFTVRTLEGVELAASVFDKSTENISSNRWGVIRASGPEPSYPVRRTFCGMDEAYAPIYDTPTYYKVNGAAVLMKSAPAPEANVMMAQSARVEDAVALDMAYGADIEESEEVMAEEAAGGSALGYVRTDFANTVAWEPFLRADSNGEAKFSFTNADKLSTYYVQLFAHDKGMRNAVLRREMVVTIPVKVAVVEPGYLYEGDSYFANVTLSNNTEAPVSGMAEVSFLAGTDHMRSPLISSKKEEVTVPASGSISLSFKLDKASADSLGLLAKFSCENDESGSDAVFVTLPVLKAEQTLTEAHSAVLLAGADRDSLVSVLKSEFVNIPGSSASIREISIYDMLLEAIPEKIEVQSDNLISLLDAYYAEFLLEKMGRPCMREEQKEELLAKIKECRKADGGYAWFKDMDSSPVITAVVLERFFLMGMAPDEQTVRYLDSRYFTSAKRPYWNGSINMAQYAYVRSLYPDVAFNAKDADRKALAEFRKAFRQYLVPSSKRGLNGMILAKALRMETLINLTSGKEGLALAKGWGVRLLSSSRMSKSLMKDTESLVQYAQEHKSGGLYFPNAVLPWRGLMESELYAHTLLCDLLERQGHQEISDGIRLWLMIQKETQQWHSDPAYIQALGMVLDGPEKILQTKVIALKGSFSKPFGQIAAAGNGISIERKYFIGDKELQDSDMVKVGDRVRAEYHVNNEENRSFVVLRAPRPALLRPVQQLSGYQRGAYRSVLAASTEYWYEVFPEGHTVVTEEFYVTQQGSFRSPVSDIECLYAPHYRANDAGGDYTLESQ